MSNDIIVKLHVYNILQMWRCGDLLVGVLNSRLSDKSLSPDGETVLCSWA